MSFRPGSWIKVSNNEEIRNLQMEINNLKMEIQNLKQNSLEGKKGRFDFRVIKDDGNTDTVLVEIDAIKYPPKGIWLNKGRVREALSSEGKL